MGKRHDEYNGISTHLYSAERRNIFQVSLIYLKGINFRGQIFWTFRGN